MGFYGNITNNARTTFSFDKIYSSRYEMDLSAGIDGIYVGRYVLVNYKKLGKENAAYRDTYFAYDKDGTGFKVYSVLSACEGINISKLTNSQSESSNNNFAYNQYITGANELFEEENAYSLFLSGIENNLIKPEDCQNLILKFLPGRKIEVQNPTSKLYKKITSYSEGSGYTFKSCTEDDFIAFYTSKVEENDFILPADNEDVIRAKSEYKYHAHIINNTLYYESNTPLETNDIVVILPSCYYQTNETTEFWQVKQFGNEYVWQVASNEEERLYAQNFNKDVKWYRTKRGYDATVWQKVYANGREEYILIADLNTVIPTFDVGIDAPTQTPIPPHFDINSTNIYYKLHTQPQWGLRIKSANNTLQGEAISPKGIVQRNLKYPVRNNNVDSIYYPSDKTVKWKTNLYDIENNTSTTKYYNPNTEKWDDEESLESQVPAAIYFNKDGFNSNQIRYSSDIIDDNRKEAGVYNKKIKDSGWNPEINDIMLDPSGQSGLLYTPHDGSGRGTVAADTYELSIMLPQLGDTIATLWDLIYGGRETNKSIDLTNTRNQDISWEDGSSTLSRRGLRLVPNNGAIGLAYSDKEANTLAGCINSVHDLMGMIITTINQENLIYRAKTLTKAEYLNFSEKENLYIKSSKARDTVYVKVLNLSENEFNALYENNSTYTFYEGISHTNEIALEGDNTKKYDFNKIYYNPVTQAYYRKHETYSYTELEYEYMALGDINIDNYIPKLFYIKDANNEYQLSSGDYDKNQTYYARIIKTDGDNLYTAINPPDDNNEILTLKVFNPSDYWYCNYTNLNNSNSELLEAPFKDDFIKDTIYYKDRDYYSLKISPQDETGAFVNGNNTAATPYELRDGYEPNKYYYKDHGNYWLDTAENPFTDKISSATVDQNNPITLQVTDYYTIDDEKVINLSATEGSTFGGIYVPNIYYYRWPSFNEDGSEIVTYDRSGNNIVSDGAIYKLANGEIYAGAKYPTNYIPEDGQIMPSDLSVYNSKYSNKSIAFYKVSQKKSDKTTGEEYIKYTKWTEVTFSDATPYRPNSYFYSYYYTGETSDFNIITYANKNNSANKYIQYKVDAELAPREDVIYYRKDESYIKTDELLTIDRENSYNLVNFEENTFYKKIYKTQEDEETGEPIEVFVGYELATEASIAQDMEYFINNPDSIFPIYYAFGAKNIGDESKKKYIYYENNAPIIDSSIITQQKSFYVNNTYHYRVENGTNNDGSYRLAGDLEFDDTKKYYKVEEVEFYDVKKNCFVEGEEYYTKDEDGEYHLEETGIPEASTTYYLKNDVYVLEDRDGILSAGAKWNENVTILPSNIRLAKRDSKYELVPLKGFARNLNTIHGLIVKINQLLETNDKLTRSEENVQGLMNNIKDIIAKFDSITPNQITIVDAYGRIRSAKIDSVQTSSIKNVKDKQSNNETDEWYNARLNNGVYADQFQKVASTDKMRKQWITANICGDPSDPKMIIHHNYQKVNDVSSTLDKNTGATTGKVFNTTGTDDILKIYLPIVDETGHVVGAHNEDITLPFGFKNLKPENYSGDEENWSHAAGGYSTGENTIGIIADNTQDTLNLKAGNKWIRLMTDATNENDGNNTLTIAHQTHLIAESAGTSYDLNNETEDKKKNTITIPDLTFDKAGHLSESHPHEYTLPYGFKTIKGDNTNVVTAPPKVTGDGQVADNTQDSLTIKASNKWLNVDDSVEDTIQIGHIIQDFADTDTTANFKYGLTENKVLSNTDIFIVPSFSFDESGHVTAAANYTITVPNNFNDIKIGAASTAVTNLVHTSGDVKPDNITDTLNINIGNKWLAISADDTNNIITFGHVVSTISEKEENIVADVSNITFGDTITVGDVEWDEAGHISGYSSHSINIPGIDTSNIDEVEKTNANIITEISFTNGTSATIDITRENIGNIELGDYTAPDLITNDDDTIQVNALDITETTTVSSAINLLNAEIMNEKFARLNLDAQIASKFDDLDANISNEIVAEEDSEEEVVQPDVIVTITQTDGLITDVTANVTPDRFATIEALSSKIDASTTFKYTDAVDGVLNIDEETQEPIEGSWAVEPKEQVNYTIAQLMAKVAELEARLAALE